MYPIEFYKIFYNYDTIQAVEFFGQARRGFFTGLDGNNNILYLVKNGKMYKCKHETAVDCRIVLVEKKKYIKIFHGDNKI
jgi:hypothetical protein